MHAPVRALTATLAALTLSSCSLMGGSDPAEPSSSASDGTTGGTSGGTVVLATKLSLTADNPIADAAFGIDNTFASRPLGEGAFASFSPTTTPPEEYALADGGDRLVPIDSAR